jgi:hypothetical protein
MTPESGMTRRTSAAVAVLVILGGAAGADAVLQPWPAQEAWQWYNRRPWLVGFNFLPSTAVNDTEMWQKESFDAPTIERELGWARKIGFNSCRVFLQYLVWKADPEGFNERFDRFLAIADREGISVMPILFDDCDFAGKEPYLGKQDDPVPGVHNSGWVPSPAHAMVADPKTWGDLEKYVKDVVGRFGRDKRIIFWDLYNEPSRSLALVESAFGWAREARPAQPLTTCIFGSAEMQKRIPEFCDIISFHNYGNLGGVKAEVARLKQFGRPIVCSEWMARGMGSLFESHLPFFGEERIGCYSWGLVAGKTQTYYPWGSKKGSPEPALWHHDLLRRDGTPFDAEEILTIGQATGLLRAPAIVTLAPTAEKAPVQWRCSLGQPPADWARPEFGDSAWEQAPAPFGTREPQFGRHPGTEWKSPDIWLRRTCEVPDARLVRPAASVYHDEDVEIYINGVLAAKAGGYSTGYRLIPLTPEGAAALKQGKNVLAVHCHQTVGGQYIDVGLVDRR